VTSAAVVVPALTTLASRVAVDEDRVTPGLLGFAVVAALGVATWLLVKSMRSRLRKIEVDEDADTEAPGRRDTDSSGPGGGDEPGTRG
jgi:hypothetical protein